jgi:hypothetical protein
MNTARYVLAASMVTSHLMNFVLTSLLSVRVRKAVVKLPVRHLLLREIVLG